MTCYFVFQQFGTDHTLLFEHIVIDPFHMLAELFQAVVRPHVRCLCLFSIPLFGIASDTGGYRRAFPVNGDSAEYGGRTVRTDLVTIDIE